MKKIQNNLHYFKISKNNQEKLLHDFYVFDEKHPDLNRYIKNTKEIKNILITIQTLQGKKEKSAVIDKYFINKFLKNNPNNYWVNTAGFESLISDLK